MAWLGELWRRLGVLLRRTQLDRDLKEEMRLHLDLKTQRLIEAGVDAVGIHLQSDARRANPKLIEDDYLSDVARAVFERIGKAVPVQVVGGLSIAQAKSLAKAGLRAFVISGNMGLPDGNARYNLPPAEIQRLVADFIAEVSGG